MQELFIGADHAGYHLKERLTTHLQAHFPHFHVHDLGTHEAHTSVDYPDYGFKVACAVVQANAVGVLICGSGIGISIAANRVAYSRAALCISVEMARLAREHNNANILVLGARLIDEATAIACLNAFLTTDFEGGRHAERVIKLG